MDLRNLFDSHTRRRSANRSIRAVTTAVGSEVSMPEIDESGDDVAMVIACIQGLDEFVTRKLPGYPLDAVTVARPRLEAHPGDAFQCRQTTQRMSLLAARAMLACDEKLRRA